MEATKKIIYSNKTPLVLNHILGWVILFAISFFVLNTASLNIGLDNPLSKYNYYEPRHFISFFIMIMLLFLTFIFIEKKRNYYKPQPWIYALCAVFFITNTIAVFLQKDSQYYIQTYLTGNSYPLTITLSSSQRLYFVLSGFLFSLTPLFYLYLIPRQFTKTKTFEIVIIVFLILLELFNIYSYIAEADKYKNFITNLIELKNLFNSPLPVSIFYQRNIYAYFLTAGIFLTYIWIIMKPRWWKHLFCIHFIIQIFFTISKTNIFISLGSYLLFFIIRIIFSFKKYPVRNIISSLFFVGLIITIVVLTKSAIQQKEGYIYKFIKNIIIDTIQNSAGNTLQARKELWNTFFNYMNVTDWIFGKGRSLFEYIDLQLNSVGLPIEGETVNHVHNAYLCNIGWNGIIGSIVTVGMTGWVVFILFKYNWKTNKPLVFTELIILATIIFESFFDAYFFFGIYAQSLIFTILLVIPSLSKYYSIKEKNYQEALEIKSEEKTVEIKSGIEYSKPALVFSSLLILFFVSSGTFLFSRYYIPFPKATIGLLVTIGVFGLLTILSFVIKIKKFKIVSLILINITALCVFIFYVICGGYGNVFSNFTTYLNLIFYTIILSLIGGEIYKNKELSNSKYTKKLGLLIGVFITASILLWTSLFFGSNLYISSSIFFVGCLVFCYFLMSFGYKNNLMALIKSLWAPSLALIISLSIFIINTVYKYPDPETWLHYTLCSFSIYITSSYFISRKFNGSNLQIVNCMNHLNSYLIRFQTNKDYKWK